MNWLVVVEQPVELVPVLHDAVLAHAELLSNTANTAKIATRSGTLRLLRMSCRFFISSARLYGLPSDFFRVRFRLSFPSC
jgi:hypothetical protein